MTESGSVFAPYTMRTRFFILIAFLASASAATAQHTARNRHKQKDTLIVKAYADSLAAIKAKLDTTIRVDADTPTDARTFCLCLLYTSDAADE